MLDSLPLEEMVKQAICKTEGKETIINIQANRQFKAIDIYDAQQKS